MNVAHGRIAERTTVRAAINFPLNDKRATDGRRRPWLSILCPCPSARLDDGGSYFDRSAAIVPLDTPRLAAKAALYMSYNVRCSIGSVIDA